MEKFLALLDTMGCILNTVEPKSIIKMVLGEHSERYTQEWVDRLNRDFLSFVRRLDPGGEKRLLQLLKNTSLGYKILNNPAIYKKDIDVYLPGEYFLPYDFQKHKSDIQLGIDQILLSWTEESCRSECDGISEYIEDKYDLKLIDSDIGLRIFEV